MSPDDSPTMPILAGLAVLAVLVGGTTALAKEAPIADRSPLGSTSADAPLSAPRAVGVNDWGVTSEKVLPSVVSLRAESSSGIATGSGVILDKDGFIVTNNHVVQFVGKGQSVIVTLHDSTVYEATVVGTDVITDLAVLKLRKAPDDLQPITIGASPRVGDQVMAVGSPLGLKGSVSDGIISAVDRPITPGAGAPKGASIVNGLQTDAAINQGNSGGALVDTEGRLIGVNSAIATDGTGTGFIGIGFSIPVDLVKRVTPYLKKGETFPHGRFGVMVGTRPVVQGGETTMGASIESVEADSPAERAGLRRDDVILLVDGVRVVSQEQIVGLVNTYEHGDEVGFSYVRNGKLNTTAVTIAPR